MPVENTNPAEDGRTLKDASDGWDDEDGDWDDQDEDFDDDDASWWQAEYDSPLDAVIDACYGAKLFNEIADFAPPHVALEYIASKIQEVGHTVSDDDGKAFFLDVAKLVYVDSSILEHNSFIACFYCSNEVEPVVDERLLRRFIDWKSGQIQLQDFYRCPDCGGQITVKKAHRDRERHLPWFHYAHGDDFDVADTDKPQS